MASDSERPPPFEPGYQIDRYELLYALAQGGMGSVWVARLLGKHGFEKLYAIKTILPQYAGDPQFRTMFLDEVAIASAIVHPNVAQIFELGEQQNTLYAVMEYVEGDSLVKMARSAQKRGARIPMPVILRIMADVCSGLHAAHELTDQNGKLREIVHRDVSPHNILVTTNGTPKLIDFGVAKAKDRLSGETVTPMLKGKVHFCSPEQALPGGMVDRRADLWSAGAVIYFLLAGQAVHPGSETEALVRLVSGHAVAPLPDWVPEPIVRVVQRALEHAPEKRFQTGREMGDALEAAMSEAKITCSEADVAACVGEYGKERAESRQRALELAKRAIVDKGEVRKLLEQARLFESGSHPSAKIPLRKLGETPSDAPTLMGDAGRSNETPLASISTVVDTHTNRLWTWIGALSVLSIIGLAAIAVMATRYLAGSRLPAAATAPPPQAQTAPPEGPRSIPPPPIGSAAPAASEAFEIADPPPAATPVTSTVVRRKVAAPPPRPAASAAPAATRPTAPSGDDLGERIDTRK